MSARELPAGWEVASISSLISGDGVLSDGDWIESKDQDPNGDVRLIQLADVGDGIFINKSSRFLTSIRASELGCTYLSPGDVLIARMPDPLGRACIFPGDAKPSVTAVDVLIARPGKDGVDARWLMHAVNSPQVRSEIALRTGGTTRQRISGGNLKALELWIPPSSEQRRIVEKIEALTARSRRAREALDSLPALIDRYRQSILAAAFRGDLTADWRQDADVADDSLPDGWTWQTVAQIIDEGPTNGYSPKAAPDGSGTASLKLSATTSGRMVLNDYTTKRLLENVPATAKYWLRNGDILIQRANSIEYLGATAVYHGEKDKYIYPDLMMRVRIADASLRTYFWRYMNGRAARQWLKERATGTAGNMPKISGATLKELPVPVPPKDERALIVRRIDRAFAAIDQMEGAQAEAHARLSTLDQSILAKAFRGELVPQDPNEEPASVLLERIRAERAEAGDAPRRGRRPRVTAGG